MSGLFQIATHRRVQLQIFGLTVIFMAMLILDHANLMVAVVEGIVMGIVGAWIAYRVGRTVQRRIEAMNAVILQMEEIAARAAQATMQIKLTSAELLDSARQQMSGASQQSTAVDDTRRTLETLLGSVREVTSVAQGVLANAESTQRNNQIITERIGELTARSQRIVEILEVIKDIANKSELLALNAALEGTKAGEAGRGFSLVANQMQRLAENVMGSVRDIKQLTVAIREATNASVLATEEGAKLAADTTRSARQIATIVHAQQGGTEQVTEVMDEVAAIARQTTEGSKEAVGAVQSLSTLADQLDALIEQFRSGGIRTYGARKAA
jgi:methyl-accepting chemotaxis protein